MLLAWSALWSTAELASLRPRIEVAAWYAAGWQASVPGATDARRRIDFSIKLNPIDPAYHLALGRLYEWQARGQAFDAGLAQNMLDKAAASLRRAVQLRPTWGEAWVTLALVKAYQGETDQEAVTALKNALTFSPWESRTLEDSTIAGMLLWPALNDEVRHQFRQAVDRVFALGRGRFVVDAAIRYGWVSEVQMHIPAAHELRRYLNERLKKPGNGRF